MFVNFSFTGIPCLVGAEVEVFDAGRLCQQFFRLDALLLALKLFVEAC